MQSLVLPPSSFIATEFGHPRFDPGPDRLPLNLSRSTNARRCTPRDLPLPRSMSDSVPAEDPLETSATVRRLGHPELPQPVTTVATSSASSTAATISAGGAPGSLLASGSPATTTTVHESPLHRVLSGPGDDLSRQGFPIADSFSASRLPPTLGGQVPPPPQPSASTYSQTTFGVASSPGTGARGIAQKSTRRTKAHVASACVNCKKKHLGCDPARPCRRCVLSGKEATCVDVTHKKRGRPPLKAEEASLRSYPAQVDSGAGPGGPHAHHSRRAMHRATSSREIRPVTDLQIPSGPPGAMGLRAAAMPPHRWPPSVYPSNLDPALTMQRNIGHRRFSSSGSVQSITSASPPGFVPMPGTYNPSLGAGRMPMGVGRPLSSYGNQAFHPAASPPQYHQAFAPPMSPYTDSTRMVNRMAMGEPPRESYLESPVRLPPIYPPTMASPSSGPQSHRLSDPYSTTWSPRARDEGFEPRQPMPAHGYLDPISPTSQMRQAMSEVSYGETVPRVLSAVDPTLQRHSLQLSSTRVRDEEPTTEADSGESRPTKRRKMALDDMVNG
ncbi:hypothetical protein P170DRAFT_367607 [Aspergillus steynii IBT 23096]|uniref:Transcription activator of gluconeogenesis acuK n=1 Tax=Aspergillus steynii IBT 23096 TaxID=1392250 RepID=A0A2I2FV09_9EURO|nr:uncharacterized protein P170DRAFT_367607 [Aspergillus steynii IBT 23096]PLB44480.1 hypothetical protein P170DRAFT_367607 [Aspergillus steynii IBT 23096]